MPRPKQKRKNGLLDWLNTEQLRPSSALLVPDRNKVLSAASEAGRRAARLDISEGTRTSAKRARELAGEWTERYYGVTPRGISKREIGNRFQAGYLLVKGNKGATKNPDKSTGDRTLDNLIDRYEATGRIVFVYPRKKCISINGGRCIKYAEAKEYLKEAMARLGNPIDWAETLAIGAGTAAGSLIGETIAGPLIERGKRFLGIGESEDREQNPSTKYSARVFSSSVFAPSMTDKLDTDNLTLARKWISRRLEQQKWKTADYLAEIINNMTGETVYQTEKRFGPRRNGIRGVAIKNPSPDTEMDAEAIRLAESFHGRSLRDIYEYDEPENYDEDLAELGELRELELSCNNGKSVCPLQFNEDSPKLASSPDGKQLYFIGGDQDLGLILDELRKQKVDELSVHTSAKTINGKRMVPIATVHTIAYFADKHHLTGPKQQKNGMEYEHEFGEKTGIKPVLFYDGMNKRMCLVGGDYFVGERGIEN